MKNKKQSLLMYNSDECNSPCLGFNKMTHKQYVRRFETPLVYVRMRNRGFVLGSGFTYSEINFSPYVNTFHMRGGNYMDSVSGPYSDAVYNPLGYFRHD